MIIACNGSSVEGNGKKNLPKGVPDFDRMLSLTDVNESSNS